MAHENDAPLITKDLVKKNGAKTRRNSMGKPNSSGGIPNYLRASTGSCHDFCKYGKLHEFEEKAKTPILMRKTPPGSKKPAVAKLKHSVDLRSPMPVNPNFAKHEGASSLINEVSPISTSPNNAKTSMSSRRGTEGQSSRRNSDVGIGQKKRTSLAQKRALAAVVDTLSCKPSLQRVVSLKKHSRNLKVVPQLKIQNPNRKSEPEETNKDMGEKTLRASSPAAKSLKPHLGGAPSLDARKQRSLSGTMPPNYQKLMRQAKPKQFVEDEVKNMSGARPPIYQKLTSKAKPKQFVEDGVNNLEAALNVRKQGSLSGARPPNYQKLTSKAKPKQFVEDEVKNLEAALNVRKQRKLSGARPPIYQKLTRKAGPKQFMEDEVKNLEAVLPAKSQSGKEEPVKFNNEESPVEVLKLESEQNENPNAQLHSPLLLAISPSHANCPHSSSHEEDEPEYTITEEEDNYTSEEDDTGNLPLSETSKLLYDRRPKKSGSFLAEDKVSMPTKLKFRKGRVINLQSDEHAGPRRLRFRQARKLGDNQNVNGDAGRRIYKRRVIVVGERVGHSSSEKVVLRHQDAEGAKKDGQGLFNNVIEETASKLAEARKSKVKALVGAFETVISLQDSKPPTNAIS